MPINELEQHPCLSYLEQDNITPLNDYQGLIIGNFPSDECTDILKANLEITVCKLQTPNFRMKFQTLLQVISFGSISLELMNCQIRLMI